MAREEKEFEKMVRDEGVFGYVLQKWNPRPGAGYEQIDSCWGFVGKYKEGDPLRDHYIVDEMKRHIPG